MDQKPNRADQYNEARALSKARRFNEAVELSESCLMDPTLPRLYCVRFALLIAWSTHDWKKARVSDQLRF
jgi:hypothetical protein